MRLLKVLSTVLAAWVISTLEVRVPATGGVWGGECSGIEPGAPEWKGNH